MQRYLSKVKRKNPLFCLLVNLLFVRSRQAEIIVVNCFIQGRYFILYSLSTTRMRVEPRSRDRNHTVGRNGA